MTHVGLSCFILCTLRLVMTWIVCFVPSLKKSYNDLLLEEEWSEGQHAENKVGFDFVCRSNCKARR